jgi:hypothetical protein
VGILNCVKNKKLSEFNGLHYEFGLKLGIKYTLSQMKFRPPRNSKCQEQPSLITLNAIGRLDHVTGDQDQAQNGAQQFEMISLL